MTKVMNRADRMHNRRMGALERIVNGCRRVGTNARIESSTANEIITLQARTAVKPGVVFTRKRKVDGWSVARTAHNSGRLDR